MGDVIEFRRRRSGPGPANARDERALTCTSCRDPLDPAAAAGGFTTHPGCDLPPPPAAIRWARPRKGRR